MNIRAFFPFLIWLETTRKDTVLADLIAGLTGAIIVLPQGIAYALIAGLPPEYGLYTAIITPVIAGLFGSSLHLISGPTAAISIVILSIVSNVVPADGDLFIPYVLTMTLLVGCLQLMLGFARMGSLINFISHTVVIGFTAGAAILIATSQLKYIFNATVPSGASFITTWDLLIQQLDQINIYTCLIALITIASTLLIKKVSSKLPAMFFGMVAGSITCYLLNGQEHNVALVGALSGQLPPFAVPNLSFDAISTVLPGAVAVAILGLVEAVAIARAVSIRSGQTINGNQEFIGQGLSNMVGSFYSCYAGSGSFTRTGANYDSGAKTPLSGIFAAVFLVLILLFVPTITSYLPLSAMAGAILLIAWNLIDFKHIKEIVKASKQESIILFITLLSTLIMQLEFAIYLGVILSLIFYLRRTSTPQLMEVAPKSYSEGTELRSISRFNLPECPQAKIIRIDGSIFFGAITHIQCSLDKLLQENRDKKIVLVDCSGINFIDLAGVEFLHQEVKRLKESNIDIFFCSLKNKVKDEIESLGYLDKIGAEKIHTKVDEALNSLMPKMAETRCKSCNQHVFKQCPAGATDKQSLFQSAISEKS